MEIVESATCPQIDRAFALLAKKWMGPILFSLCRRELFFSDLEKSIPGVSARVLTQRIRELEAARLVVRTVHLSTPLRVSYRLSEKGEGLASILQGVAVWAKAHR
jgi:DNA-binding HxlR family transcriptional regulator